MTANSSEGAVTERERLAGDHPPAEFGPSAADTAYQAVKQWILGGELTPGELVSEGDVAAKLGHSRTPVREAFLRLQSEGWMRLYPKRGALVVPVGAREAGELYDARLTLELAALREVIANRTERRELARTLRRTITFLAAHAASGDDRAYWAADRDFRREIVRASGNTLLNVFYDHLVERQQVQLATASKSSLSIELSPLCTDNHLLLADALLAGDADECEARLRRHARNDDWIQDTNRR